MKKYNYKASAIRTFKIESDAISDLSKQLDSNFNLLCNSVISCKGKLIVMGVGKSGHIGKKSQQHFQALVLDQSLFIQQRQLMETLG